MWFEGTALRLAVRRSYRANATCSECRQPCCVTMFKLAKRVDLHYSDHKKEMINYRR